MSFLKISALSLTLALMSGCANNGFIPGDGEDKSNKAEPGSRYSMKNDTAPDIDIDVSDLPNAVPTAEPYSKGGNASPYVVWGKTYHVLDTHVGYSRIGLASWYGKKFHGHKTSNGETYNMYKMSAAHKSLPIPSFAEVTNLENGKKVIVRVNDRGPFHSDRIIDLSYAAAKKLDFMEKGTAKVRVSSISVENSGSYVIAGGSERAPDRKAVVSSKPLPKTQTVESRDYFVQLGAFSESKRAAQYLETVNQKVIAPLSVHKVGIGMLATHKIMAGPFESENDVQTLLKAIKKAGFTDSFIVRK